MVKQEQLSLGMARHVSRYVGVFVGTVVGVGAEIVGACEKRAKAAGGLFSRRAKISEEVAGEVPEPSLERVVPEPSEGAEAKVETEETEPAVPEAEVRAEETEPVVPEAKLEVEETEPAVPKAEVKAEETEPVVPEAEVKAEETEPVVREKVKAKPKKTTKATTKSSG